jgi:OPA family glycerol-3-phosphate transporter-like MFS transporter/OPA family sugar phosphate sensor protein UhpC-like MFS transporter
MEPNTADKMQRPQGLLGFFAPAPAIPALPLSPEETKAAFLKWRIRVVFSCTIGYALFYFVRKNLSVAMPMMGKDLGISKADLGLFLTLHGVIYGVARFANGFLADRSNARKFMVVGLLASALLNFGFGLGSTVTVLGILWLLNGWAQGMGFPPISRLMTHWIPPKNLATVQSAWNTSHSIGASLVVVLCGYLVAPHGQAIPGNWRLCFFVPAGLAVAGAVLLWFLLPDTPPSVGLPEVNGTEHITSHADDDAGFRSFIMEHVFRNKYIWLLALANFFVYVVRYALLDWGPTFLTEAKGASMPQATWMIASFEWSGIVGMLVGGVLTDYVFGGRGSRTCLFYMAMATVGLFLFWRTPVESTMLSTLWLCVVGFSIYGPQALIGIIVANLATKRAAATAAGFTGFFGYASTVLSGWGLGLLAQKYGWNAVFEALLWMGGIGTALFALAWKAKAHGYRGA